jgi:hypothetical protein
MGETMGTVKRLAAGLLLVLAAATPSLAGVAVIETTAPLREPTNHGVKAAVMAAVQNAAKGAEAMGLTHFTVKGVRVLPEAVVVQIWATDAEIRQPDGDRPDAGRPDQPGRPDMSRPEDPVDESGRAVAPPGDAASTGIRI